MVLYLIKTYDTKIMFLFNKPELTVAKFPSESYGLLICPIFIALDLVVSRFYLSFCGQISQIVITITRY